MVSSSKIPNKQAIITCGIFIYSTRTKKLLICHPTQARWNQWSIPKGLKEGNENTWDVARRELAEETGLLVEQLHVIKLLSLSPVNYEKQNKILESFLLLTDSDVEHVQYTSSMTSKHGIAEVDAWKWVSLTEAKKWLHESQSKSLDQIMKLIKEEHRTEAQNASS